MATYKIDTTGFTSKQKELVASAARLARSDNTVVTTEGGRVTGTYVGTTPKTEPLGYLAQYIPKDATYRAATSKNIQYYYNPSKDGGYYVSAEPSGNSYLYDPSSANPLTGISSKNALTLESLSTINSTNLNNFGPLPQQKTVDASGALAGVDAGRKPGFDEEGNQIDPVTGLPIKKKNTDLEDAQEKWFREQERLFRKTPSAESLYNKAAEMSGVDEARKVVNNLNAQINVITAKAQADQLAVVGQGRGIPEAIISNQQAAISRKAAIDVLPLAAQLAAAQDNKALAEQHLDTYFKLLVDDVDRTYKFRSGIIDKVYEFAADKDKKRLEEQKTREANSAAEAKLLAADKVDALRAMTTANAPQALISLVQNSTDRMEIARYAGPYLDRKTQVVGSAETGYGTITYDSAGNIISRQGSGANPPAPVSDPFTIARQFIKDNINNPEASLTNLTIDLRSRLPKLTDSDISVLLQEGMEKPLKQDYLDTNKADIAIALVKGAGSTDAAIANVTETQQLYVNVDGTAKTYDLTPYQIQLIVDEINAQYPNGRTFWHSILPGGK